MFTISREGVQDADRDGLLGANRSNSLAIARICNNADRPIPRLHTRVEIVNTLLVQQAGSWCAVQAEKACARAAMGGFVIGGLAHTMHAQGQAQGYPG